jgi:tetratricopeptide (TPR) repeat protein
MRRRAAVATWALAALAAGPPAPAAPLPIDPLWQSAAFRRAFTASYGVDARIEPLVSAAEKAVLEAVATRMAAGDREGAAGLLARSDLLTGSPALHFNLGNLRFEQGRAEDAVENFRRAIQLHPNFRDAHRNLAVTLVQKGDLDAAQPHLTRAVELGAADGLTFGLLGYGHEVAGRHQPALQSYRLAQITMPTEPQWVLGEAEALAALGEHSAAASLFDTLLEARPGDAGLWLRQAAVWGRAQEPDRSIANLEFVHRMGALGASDLVTLGQLYVQQGLPGIAIERFLSAMSADPVAPLGEAVAALEALVSGRYFVEARTLAARIDEAYPAAGESPEAARLRRARAMVEIEVGDPGTGADLLEAVLAGDPRDGLALLLMARFLEGESRLEEAALLLDQAATLEAVRADALFELGRLLAAKRDYQGAVRALDESLALSPRPGLETYVESLRAMAGRPGGGGR